MRVNRLFFLILFILISWKGYSQGGDHNTVEENLKSRKDIVFYGSFEEGFDNESWEKRWGIEWVTNDSDREIISDGFHDGKSLRVKYPRGGLGPLETGIQFPILFRKMKEESTNGLYRELYFRYYVKFEEGFDFNKGGKLPGLMGGGRSWVRSGGNQPDGTNGWTLRFMWREEGEIVVYAYVPKSVNGKWGSKKWGQNITTDIEAQPGERLCIEQYVNVGTPGKDNGKLKVWIDGEKQIDINDMRFWDVENNNGLIGGIYFSTFHGGNSQDWAPLNDSFAQFDGLVVAKNRVRCFND